MSAVLSTTKLTIALATLLITAHATSSENADITSKAKDRLNRVIPFQSYPDISKAIAQIDSSKDSQVVIGESVLRLANQPSEKSKPRIYLSADKTQQIILTTKNGITYGSAVVNGESYSIYNGLVSKFDSPEQLTDDTPDSHQEKEETRTLHFEDRLALLNAERKAENRDSTTKTSSKRNQEAAIIINGETYTTTPVEIDKPFRDLTTDEIFTAEQITDIISVAGSVREYSTTGSNSYVDIDHVLSIGAILESYAEYGAISFDLLNAQIDSSIQSANIILENSFVEDIGFINATTTLVTDFGALSVGNTIADRFLTKQERILYAATDQESKIWGTYTSGTCGFAPLGRPVKMLNPDQRSIAETGANAFTTTNPDNQVRNMHGVSRTGCLNSRVILHEIGHSVGLNHDRANASTDSEFGFNFGFSDSEIGKYSVMGYSCSGCYYEPLLSSPDKYDFVFGVNPYEVDGADAATYIDTSFWLKYTPLDRQELSIEADPSELDVSQTMFPTYSWELVEGAEIQTLVMHSWRDDLYYFFALPVGTNTVSIDMESFGNLSTEAYIVSGLNVDGAVQPIPTKSFTTSSRPFFNESNFYSYSSDDYIASFPEKISSGGQYELSFTLDERNRERLANYYNDEKFSNFAVKPEIYGLFQYKFGVVTEDVLEITSTIEDILETGTISATLTMPDSMPDVGLLYDLYYENRRENTFFNFLLHLEADYKDDYSEFRTSITRGTFDLILDYASYRKVLKIYAPEPFIIYRDEEGDTLDVSFRLESNSDSFDYTIQEGYTHDGQSADAIIEATEVLNQDGTMNLNFTVDVTKISQQDKHGYFITVSNGNGIPSNATTLLKNNDVPYFGSNPFEFVASNRDFQFELLVEDLKPDTNYAVELVSYEQNSSYYVELDIEYETEELNATSKRFTISAPLEYSISDYYGAIVYPVDDDGNATGNERDYLSHNYNFVIKFNEAPVIECTINEGLNEEGTCLIPTSSFGTFSMNHFVLYDINSSDTLSHSWDTSDLIFEANLDYETPENTTIELPDDIDKDWERTSLTLTTTDGKLSTSMTFILENTFYEVNVAPEITCSTSDCTYSLSQTGEYTFTGYDVIDEGEDDPIVYTWGSTDSPFTVEQVGNTPLITFPADIDTSWQEFTLDLTVSDGDLSDSQTFKIINADYSADNGGSSGGDNGGSETPNNPPAADSDSGGSLGISALFLALAVTYRRKKLSLKDSTI